MVDGVNTCPILEEEIYEEVDTVSRRVLPPSAIYNLTHIVERWTKIDRGNIFIHKLEEDNGERKLIFHLFIFHPPKPHTSNMKEKSKVEEKTLWKPSNIEAALSKRSPCQGLTVLVLHNFSLFFLQCCLF